MVHAANSLIARIPKIMPNYRIDCCTKNQTDQLHLF